MSSTFRKKRDSSTREISNSTSCHIFAVTWVIVTQRYFKGCGVNILGNLQFVYVGLTVTLLSSIAISYFIF